MKIEMLEKGNGNDKSINPESIQKIISNQSHIIELIKSNEKYYQNIDLVRLKLNSITNNLTINDLSEF